jgi:hypothetical protein
MDRMGFDDQASEIRKKVVGLQPSDLGRIAMIRRRLHSCAT